MPDFETKHLAETPDAVAPDGSDVRLLVNLPGASLAHFAFGPGDVSVSIRHRTVAEAWYFLAGRGELWREQGGTSEVTDVEPGTAITIPAGTSFQLRVTKAQALVAVGVTMPPWPGEGEAEIVDGPWAATLAPGPH